MIPLVIVIEDDAELRKYLSELLTENNLSVKTAGGGVLGLKLTEKSEPNLVLLDLTLPDLDGQAVCQQLRQQYPDLPIIILTGRDAVSDKVRGLLLGADDYITKPFAPEELVARVKARLRGNTAERAVLKIADLELDAKKFTVTRGAKPIKVTPQEFKLLEYLMQNEGIVLTRDMILNRIWLYSPDVESRVVDVYMGYLRKKIDTGFKKKLLQSVRGFGYTIKS